jgi:hypothetical protein
MADSPLSIPGTPRTASPLPSDADFARSFSPSHDDAHPLGTQGPVDDVWTSTPAPSAASPVPSAEPAPVPKGKEKAAKGPLKLLDLPVDILKEIIHQVSGRQHGRSVRLAAMTRGDADTRLHSFRIPTT